MKKLEFSIAINAKQQQVWETMLNPVTYKKWTNVSWPGSTYKGSWKEGEEIRFTSVEEGGTLGKVVECRPYEFILVKHIAVINSDGTRDTDSEIAKTWVGTTERYAFTEKNGVTELNIEIHCYEAWESMFTSGWPDALKALKEVCEQEAVHA